MSTTVDDLQIKLQGDVKSAESQIDKVIEKLGKLENKITSVGKDNGIAKSFTSASTGIKKGISDLNQCIGRINEIRKQVGDIGKDYAEKGGANLKTVAQIQKAIDNATAQMNQKREKAALAGEGTKGFESNIQQAIVLENHIASLQAKLDSINMEMAEASARRYEDSVKNIDNALAKIFGDTQAVEESTAQTVIESDGLFKEYNNVAEEVERIQHEMYGVGSAAMSSASQVREMQTAADAVSASTEKTGSKFSMIGSTIDAFKAKIENLPGFLERINVTKPTKVFTDTLNDIDKVENELEKLQKQMDRGLATNTKFSSTTTFRKLQYDIKDTENELDKLYAKLAEMEGHTHAVNWGAIGSKMKESFNSVLGVVKNVSSHVVSLANTLNKRIVGGFANFAKSLNKTDDVAKNLFKSFTKVSKMLRLMILRMALRGVINEAKQSFTELTQFSDKTAASFNKIRNAIKYLADTLVTLTAPILNASGTFRGLGNILDMVTDKIVDLINKFNQLLSALLGHSTWIKATKQTKDYTKEVDKAGKAAKKALQPFDELNNITTNDSGSGSDSGTGGSQFQELPIDPKWAKIADWLKDMWKKADFTELGALLGAKLRDALNSIPWGKIQNTARRLASSLATLLNGFFRTEGLAKSIGNTIAQAINTGLIFAEEFIKKFDFAAFGKFIGDAIVTALKNIHWQRFIDACANLGKGIATAINSLVGTGVISEIGKAIGKVVLAAVNFAFNLVTNINFEELANEIANGIKNFLLVLNNVDKETGLTGWEKLGKTISDGLLGVLKILNTALGDKDIREQISKGITDMLNQIDFASIIGQSVELIKNIALGFANVIVAAFKSEELREGIAATIPYLAGAFAISFAGKELASVGAIIGKNIMKNIATAIASGNGIALVKAALSTALGQLTAVVTMFFAGAGFGKWIGKHIFPNDKDLYEGYSGVTGTIKLTLEFVTTFYQRAFEKISEMFKKWVDYQKFCWNGVKEDFKNGTTIIYNFFVNLFGNIKNYFSNIIKDAYNWGTNLGTSIKNGLANTRIGQAITSVGGFIQKLRNNADGGILVNGQWKPIQGYAGGGQPKSAEMFLARENGAPELVGKMGSHTAVANNDQIVASVSDGVYRAVMAAMSSQNSNTNVSVELVGDAAGIFKMVRKEGNDYQKRTGNPVWA